MISDLAETVTRHRGGGRDEDGKLITSTPASLTAIAVAPGGGADRSERAREGEDVAYTVYLPAGTDLTGDDELTVRGDRCRIVVNSWPSQLGGLEVLCRGVRGGFHPGS